MLPRMFRLDQITGKPGVPLTDGFDVKVCLSMRVHKMERQVDSIEKKLDKLLSVYASGQYTHPQPPNYPHPQPPRSWSGGSREASIDGAGPLSASDVSFIVSNPLVNESGSLALYSPAPSARSDDQMSSTSSAVDDVLSSVDERVRRRHGQHRPSLATTRGSTIDQVSVVRLK
jgi:hypothetical protein